MPDRATIDAERAAVVAEAMTWLRTPYHHNQALKGVAADCVRFLNEPYASLGFTDREPAREYPPDWHFHRSEELLLEAIERRCRGVAGPPLPADIVVFRLGRCFAHCAIVVEWPVVIHAWKDAGCVSLDDIGKMPRLLRMKDGGERPRKTYRLTRWVE
jgi:hypothetical protein